MTGRNPHSGDMAQIRLIAEQVADTALVKFLGEHPEVKTSKMDLPGPIKWAAGIIAAVMTAGVIGLAVWTVTTLNDLQLAVARIEARMDAIEDGAGDRFTGTQFRAHEGEMDRRVSRLEAAHGLE